MVVRYSMLEKLTIIRDAAENSLVMRLRAQVACVCGSFRSLGTSHPTEPQRHRISIARRQRSSGIPCVAKVNSIQTTLRMTLTGPVDAAERRAAQLRKDIISLEGRLAALRKDLATLEDNRCSEARAQRQRRLSDGTKDPRQTDESRLARDPSWATLKKWPWPLSAEDYRRYGRQMIVPQIGLQGRIIVGQFV